MSLRNYGQCFVREFNRYWSKSADPDVAAHYEPPHPVLPLFTISTILFLVLKVLHATVISHKQNKMQFTSKLTCIKFEKVTQSVMSLRTIFSSCRSVNIQSFKQLLRKSVWYASTSSTFDT